ncbi:MAG: bifunctional 5,10-methylenetetrahydrofolate dehydrogenase/5,10-methenyltetrahydrofolate cyclohydrolase [Candidatus Omnitrophica bacterium]|nr:bifunctional 5,10-methylenetetrahydrofolate dehydrogenase/5,10-methenyltetrahydrofolate cyclohydrolase [Candidatus Omnitrophota bacterium]
MAKVVDGKEIARQMNDKVGNSIREIRALVQIPPRLVSVMVGRSEDAEIYINMQRKTAESVGIEFSVDRIDDGITQEDLIAHIEKLNSDSAVTAIIVQKPLPGKIDHDKIVAGINPEKDAEGIHPANLGRILRREADIVPCTPGAVMKILKAHEVDLYGKEVVIVGHSAIVGKPLSLMMLNEMATTTVCHIGTFETGNLPGHIRKADILVVAVGKPGIIKGDWIGEGAVVIDVGINKVGDTVVGDVDFSEASKKAALITPVPGGVGPVTVSILMRNVSRAYSIQNKKGV